jgi:hypothetical protein
MATQKKRKAKILVRACGSVDARVACWSEHAECVRCEGEARAAEIVRVRSKCVTATAAHSMTARPRPARPARPSTSHRPVKSDLADPQSGTSGRPRLTCPCKLLRLSGLAITMHNVRHIEWGFYSVKPATGGEGVRPGYTTATTTHTPPQTFLRQLAPFALALHS